MHDSDVDTAEHHLECRAASCAKHWLYCCVIQSQVLVSPTEPGHIQTLWCVNMTLLFLCAAVFHDMPRPLCRIDNLASNSNQSCQFVGC